MALAVHVRGQGVPVVWLPWFGVDHSFVELAVVPALPLIDHHHLFVDLPGTGGSPPGVPSSDAVLASLIDTVEEFLGRSPFLLAGFSYGGYLATALAHRLPQQVSALLTVCAGVKIALNDRDLSWVSPSVPEQHWLQSVPEELRDHFAQAVGTQTRDVASRVSEAFTANGSSDWQYLDALRSSGYQLSDEVAMDDLGMPVTFVAGRCDRIAGFLDQFHAAVRCPVGEYVLLPEAGHYLPFEQPARFGGIVSAWLGCGTTLA